MDSMKSFCEELDDALGAEMHMSDADFEELEQICDISLQKAKVKIEEEVRKNVRSRVAEATTDEQSDNVEEDQGDAVEMEINEHAVEMEEAEQEAVDAPAEVSRGKAARALFILIDDDTIYIHTHVRSDFTAPIVENVLQKNAVWENIKGSIVAIVQISSCTFANTQIVGTARVERILLNDIVRNTMQIVPAFIVAIASSRTNPAVP